MFIKHVSWVCTFTHQALSKNNGTLFIMLLDLFTLSEYELVVAFKWTGHSMALEGVLDSQLSISHQLTLLRTKVPLATHLNVVKHLLNKAIVIHKFGIAANGAVTIILMSCGHSHNTLMAVQVHLAVDAGFGVIDEAKTKRALKISWNSSISILTQVD